MYVVLWHFRTWIGTISLSGTNILFVYRYYPELAPAFRLAYLPRQVNLFHYMLLTLCLSTGPVKHRVREASHIDFVQEKRHLGVLLEIPPSFFIIYLAGFKIECCV